MEHQRKEYQTIQQAVQQYQEQERIYQEKIKQFEEKLLLSTKQIAELSRETEQKQIEIKTLRDSQQSSVRTSQDQVQELKSNQMK